MNEIKRVIYTCDVGSTLYQKKKRGPAFAWARLNPTKETKSIQVSRDIQRLVKRLELDIDEGYSVVLGFEAPLFIPVPDNSRDLSKRREGEGSRSFASQIGLSVRAEDSISLIGAAALWSGWARDLAHLHKTTLALKPSSVFKDEIKLVELDSSNR
jgi:hypothetical protein